MNIKQLMKRHLPLGVRNQYQILRSRLTAPPSEDANLHSYVPVRDMSERHRLSLFIPTVAPEFAFGGILTGLDFFFALGRSTGADLRIILDDFAPSANLSVVITRAKAAGINSDMIEVVPRLESTPQITVRSADVFLAFNWWVALNVRALALQQAAMFDRAPLPYLYLIQDYEPNFYPFSSSHMMARLALDVRNPYWAIFNSSELYKYCLDQGHKPTRSFIFEPKISESLRPYLNIRSGEKKKRILVYGRPNVSRNCFPSICGGLSAWIESDGEHTNWDIVSAGLAHRPVPLSKGRAIRSLGKLSLEEYAKLLKGTAIGISLMASPHPSYPPLEMAHFGLLTITNRYATKNLNSVHDNILSLDDVASDTLGSAIKKACSAFVRNPNAGIMDRRHSDWFLRDNQFEFLDEVCAALHMEVWV